MVFQNAKMKPDEALMSGDQKQKHAKKTNEVKKQIMKNHLTQKTLVFATLLLGVIPSIKAQVTTTLQIGNFGLLAEPGFAGTVPGGSLEGGGYYGIYPFQSIPAVGTSSGQFWSTCLSPIGDYANGSYTELTYSQAAPGINPNAWQSLSQELIGIQNAQYLWRAYSSTVIASGNNADEGAGLALAMYAALYNSTDYGKVTPMSATTPFDVTTWVNSTQKGSEYYYNLFLNGLTTAGPATVEQYLANGSILVPTGDLVYNQDGSIAKAVGSGQEFILNFSPVPEPTTMVAGALLLLPFGMSALRIMRKSRKA
jgi:hypothetical protein